MTYHSTHITAYPLVQDGYWGGTDGTALSAEQEVDAAIEAGLDNCAYQAMRPVKLVSVALAPLIFDGGMTRMVVTVVAEPVTT